MNLSSEQILKIQQIIAYLNNLDNKQCAHAASHLKIVLDNVPEKVVGDPVLMTKPIEPIEGDEGSQ